MLIRRIFLLLILVGALLVDGFDLDDGADDGWAMGLTYQHPITLHTSLAASYTVAFTENREETASFDNEASRPGSVSRDLVVHLISAEVVRRLIQEPLTVSASGGIGMISIDIESINGEVWRPHVNGVLASAGLSMGYPVGGDKSLVFRTRHLLQFCAENSFWCPVRHDPLRHWEVAAGMRLGL